MRKIMISVIAMMMVVGLMVSCDNANISPELKAEELVSVSFDEGASRGLTGSIEAFSKDKYYWKYAAQKADTSGLISGQTSSYDDRGAEWINKGTDGKASQKNLGTVNGFSQGYWNFKLFAYTDESGNNLAYTGEITGQLLKKGESNKVMVTVAPIASGNGTLKVDTAHISFVPKQNSALTAEQLASFSKVVTVQKWENGEGTTGEPVNNPAPVNGSLSYSLPAGTYKVTVGFVRNDGITYTEGYAIATVYSNVTTIVSGYLDEFTTNADFDSDAEVINKTAVSEFKTITESGNAFSTNVTLAEDGKTVQDSKVSAEVPVVSANDAVVDAIAKSSYNDGVTSRSASLKLAVDTTAATSSSVTLEIGMSSVLITTIGEGAEAEEYSETTPVKELNEYVTVKVNLSAGLSNVEVKHTVEENVLNMHKVSSEDIKGNNFTVDSDNAGVFYYNDGNGTLTIKTKTFSPFEVSYIAPVWVAKIGSTKYLSLQSAIYEASDGSIIELMTDVVVDGDYPVIINTSNKLEINLNGNSITGNGMRALWVKAGDVTISGSGTISSTEGIDASSSVIRVADADANETEAKLTIGEGVTVSSDYSYAITVFGYNKGTLVVNGTVNSKDVPAISGNGSSKFNETNITINGTVATAAENAIYHPQKGELIINGSVTGQGGIELKSGHLVVNEGASITSTIDPQTPSRNSNGCSTSGFAIVAVNNKDYKCGVNVEILGGTITGKVGIVDDDNELPSGKEKAVVLSANSEIATYNGYKWDKTWPTEETMYSLMPCWAGREATSYSKPIANKTIMINTAEEFALFASKVNSGTNYSGYTVKLENDIDLKGYVWSPINGFAGTFDGDNHTISNLCVLGGTKGQGFGLFGVSNCSVKNLTLLNVFVNGNAACGAIVGEGNGLIENCNVNGLILIGTTTNQGYLSNFNSSYIGGIRGNSFRGKVHNCTVEGADGSVIAGGRQVGGIIGFDSYGYTDSVVNCKVKNIKIFGAKSLGGIIGWSNSTGVKDCSVENTIVEFSSNASELNTIGFISGTSRTLLNDTETITYENNTVDSNSSLIISGQSYHYDNKDVLSLYSPYSSSTFVTLSNGKYMFTCYGIKKALTKGDNVTALESYYNEDITISSGKTVVIDLNGATLFGTDSQPIPVINNGELTIKNGSIYAYEGEGETILEDVVVLNNSSSV